MNAQSKVRIYKTCVRPILSCAAEIRAETSKIKRLMKITEMNILRMIKGVSLRQQIRNETIRNEIDIQDIVRWMRARRRK